MKEWTIMIYMAGDNNLAVDMAYALEQIKGVADDSANSPNLFVYYDGNSPEIPTLYCDFTDPKEPRYVRSYKVPNKLYGKTRKRNENAADPKSILNFVDWCVNRVEVEDENGEISFGRRAKNYALIFSGHSLGFQDIGLFKDETTGKSMKMFEFYGVLQHMVAKKWHLEKLADEMGWVGAEREVETTRILGERLAILGFDSCVMGMLEVGYQFENVAETMIVSEGSVPSAGWTYAKLLGCLTREDARKLTPKQVAEYFVKQFVRSQDAYTVGGVSVDMAAWDMSEFIDLSAAVDGLATALLMCFENKNSRIYRQMERVILKVHYQCQTYMFDQNIDLGDFCDLLDRECEWVAEELGDGDGIDIVRLVQDQCRVVNKQLKRTVILSGFSGGSYQYSNGVAVFFPWSRAGFEVSRKNYESLWYSADLERDQAPWTKFLDKYLNDVSLRRVEDIVEAPVGARYRYRSGVKYSERYGPMGSARVSQRAKIAGHEGTKIAGHEGTKIAGHEGTKIAGHEGTKIAGHEGTKIAGHEGTKIAGHEGTKIAGHEGTKIAGHEGTKIAGHEGTKIAGHEGTKIAGHEGTKIAGHEGTKIAGHEGTKIAGHEGTKIAGHEGTKIAGHEGTKLAGGGSSAFFDSLKLFKNIESRWDISGFTKKTDQDE